MPTRSSAGAARPDRMATTRSLLEAAVALARTRRKADLEDLLEELRIPSISTLPESHDDCLRNARWLRDRFSAMGMRADIVDGLPGRMPVVVADWDGQPGQPHLTIYGHYDVQPVDPIEEWTSPPFEPSVRDGQVWARGAADNKGNHMATVKAAEHLFAAGGPPINLRFIIEGEEEITGTTLPHYLRTSSAQLRTDAVLIFDSGMDLHSGSFGGVAPNPINTLARVIGELKGRDGHVTIPGFYEAVRKPTPDELAAWKAKDASYAETVKRMTGARALEGEPGFLALERAGSRPTLDANGFIGGFTGKGAKTVVPAEAWAKVSMRLVPDQDWESILAAFEKHVHSLTTPGVEIGVGVLGSAPPVTWPVDHPPARALQAAYREAFGKDTALIRVGGSIPVAVDFKEALGAPLVISGIAQADSAIHSPNEHLVIDNYHRGIEAVIRFICGLAET
ncbi:MAG: M20 family dipeptidase [Chloroflexi bacterium]|nr:MAG: M20 family dipeptidase [Chloroflexota bacterium]